jgi:hypothetical protein
VNGHGSAGGGGGGGGAARSKAEAPAHPDYANKKFDTGTTYANRKSKDEEVTKWAQEAGSSARNVSLAGCNKVTDAGIANLARSCPGLTEVALGGCTKVTDTSIAVLARSCPGLAVVKLYNSQVTDAGIADLARSCAGLTDINIRNCPKVTGLGIAEFKRKFPNCKVRHSDTWVHCSLRASLHAARHCVQPSHLLFDDAHRVQRGRE